MDRDLPRLRADAQDNRDRILVAARALFAENGLDVGMRAIARRAGVGPATLYRRFPTRDDLVREAFTEEMHECRQIVVDGVADDDPWRGFRTVVHRLLALNVRNRGFVDALTSAEPARDLLVGHRRELLGMLDGLVSRARAAGALRADFGLDDLVLILRAGRGLALAPEATRARDAARFARLAVDALRAPGPGREQPV
ncbi:TetR/AcrR family transcriptional regulator [Pseudonocardia sp. Ae505_Ps2]|uniref:TetR/AcrR family transcriptional regulator n=1 Tax=Pseudonocardia sp. Ae505_Ps2 TaxID=1885034 RepID=UPI00094E31C2|nr:TetR/AcrR family transcriptional regulator [Pseudonocardia sp. Ae505_Ps2]OLM12253.1 Transcriptional regulator, TetR family [Pseudonocardia sp. Ae505_Ps2]